MLGTLVTVALLAVAPMQSTDAGLAGARTCKGAFAADTVTREAHAVRCLLNAERSRRGLARLRPSSPLANAARRHAHDMVARDFFDHTSPGGSTPAQRAWRAGYRCHYVAETIAWGDGGTATAAGTVAQWMQSAPHRRAILDPRMRALGVGVARGAPLPGEQGGATVAADFGSR